MTDFSHLIGGALQAPEDPAAPRVAFSRPVGALPAQAWCTLSSPQYQRSASSCLPHAVAFCAESDVKARTGAVVQVSIMDAYYGYRVLAGDWPRDVGSYPHRAQEWHRDHGTLPDVLAPYDAGAVTTWKPKPEHARFRKVITFTLERMQSDVDQIKAEIAANRCVIACHYVYAQMAGSGPGQAGKTGYETGGPFNTSQSLGGHARCIVSYRDDTRRFGLINWWRGYGLPHPKDPQFTDSYTEIDYATAVDPTYAFDLRRLTVGLPVEV